ncbi:MAG: DUF1150 family protein [Pseudomonadota bacterium]|nr:DUF1150 family protein [Pseudomonadota bacterium]
MSKTRKRPLKADGITIATGITDAQVLNIHACTSEDLRSFGTDRLAYIRHVGRPGRPRYTIFNADGTPITTMDNLAVAIAAVRQHNMVPMAVH